MRDRNNVSRRSFLGSLGASALLGAGGASGARSESIPSTAAWTQPPVLKHPNVLVIMVDQMRLPVWLTSGQFGALASSLMPNIIGRIQANSYNFNQHYAAATNCTSARAALLTGLYVPQNAMYITGNTVQGTCVQNQPALNFAFPTWGDGVVRVNPAYRGNLWWFGKWHLSVGNTFAPLVPYGFNTRTYPGGPFPYNQSPNGVPNEGSNGGFFNSGTLASDSQITSDFLGWFHGLAPTIGQPKVPWCATVSLINPHDIAEAPGWFQPGPIPPPGLPVPCAYYNPPPGQAPQFYKSLPKPWNYEDLTKVLNKPSFQYTLQKSVNNNVGVVNDWVLFLNTYFWLQHIVDQQVGRILDALAASPFANNTVVMFLADHGEYAGSHGLHNKGGAVYDESIHVPLYVQFPGQGGATPMNQMCSAVDIFGFLCDLASGGQSTWKLAYPDLAPRQSLWNFLYSNSSETRIAPDPVGLPYILHTFDESNPLPASQGKCHIVGMRTKHDPDAGGIGGKLAYYWQWGNCSVYPNSTAPDGEFYDYDRSTTNNAFEMGNDFFSTDSRVQRKIGDYNQVLGNWGPPSTGLIGTELSAPLTGKGTDGEPLSQVLTRAQEAYLNYIWGSCT